MFSLPLSLKAWNTGNFNVVIKREISALDPDLLPLQQGLQHSSYAITDRLSVTILNTRDSASDIIVKAGILYNGIIAGCSCSDDPTPIDETNEYCEVLFYIDKYTANTTVELIG
jgi:hypothetical protein